MVIWPEFRMRQYRVNDHPYHAPQFTILEDLDERSLSELYQRAEQFSIDFSVISMRPDGTFEGAPNSNSRV